MNGMDDVIVLVADPDPGARTRAVAEALSASILAQLGSGLVGSLTLDLARTDADPQILTGARLLVVASPARHGSYTGILKVFLDGLAPGALHGLVALPISVASDVSDVEATSEDLARLLERLGATVAATIGVQESELNDIAGVADAAADSVAAALRPHLG